MSNHALYLVRMDVAHDHEAIFNEVYDREHVPNLRGGARRAPGRPLSAAFADRAALSGRLRAGRAGRRGQRAWKKAGELGRWPGEMRPNTMNRHLTRYEWAGGNGALTGKTPYVFWVMMDVERHREALFNDLYDNEHLPLLLKLPGSVNAVRYRTKVDGEPRYLCAYEVENTTLPMSKLWNDTSDIGRWKPEVRPYTYNKRYIVSERVLSLEAAMKITQVAVERGAGSRRSPYLAGGRAVDANWHVLARITTSDGVEGIGYIVYPRPDLMTAIGHAARELGEHLIGMSVLEPEAAWDRLARRGDWVGPGGLLHCALAPLDIAVWDAGGKTLGQPLHRLLGGYRDRLPTYASDGLWSACRRPSSPPRRSATSRTDSAR